MTRSRSLGLFAVGALLWAPPALGQTAGARTVRSHDAAIVAAINYGATRSATLSGLLETIRQRHGIVYVERGSCMRRSKSCLLLNLVTAGEYRMLFVHVDRNMSGDALTTSIAHELQHAAEVLGNQQIATGSAMYLFYTREGLQMRGYFETNAALKTTILVRAELQESGEDRRHPPALDPPLWASVQGAQTDVSQR
jgi:hypothetical protein